MDLKKAVDSLSAMAQETRLSVLKLLVQYGEKGAAAGVMGKKLGIPHNTLSFHLSHLSQAGLVTSRRAGRSIIYCADFGRIQKLVGYIMENCCGGDTSCLTECVPVQRPRKRRA